LLTFVTAAVTIRRCNSPGV